MIASSKIWVTKECFSLSVIGEIRMNKFARDWIVSWGMRRSEVYGRN